MNGYLIDDRGQRWPAGSMALRASLSAQMSAKDFCDFAVRNLGYVHTASTASGVRIWLRPAFVKQPTLAELLEGLCTQKSRRTVISYLDSGWQSEIAPDAPSAVDRLIALVEKSQSVGRRFHRRALDPDALPPNHPLRSLIESWASSGGEWHDEEMRPLLHGPINGRFTVSRFDAASNRLELCCYGPGFEATAKSWIDRSHGQRVEDQVDHAYGCWIADTYRTAMRSGQPIIDAVDATLNWPDHGSQRYRYVRVILPFRSTDRTIVLSASMARDDLVERSLMISEAG